MKTLKVQQNRFVFNDNNKLFLRLILLILSLNLINAFLFFLLFNQEDFYKWIWLTFAVINISLFWLFLTKLSWKDQIVREDITGIEKHSFWGYYFKLKNGHIRKIYENLSEREVLMIEKSLD